MEYVSDFSQDQDEDDFDSEERPPGMSVSSSICPVVIEPEIDIEIPEAKSVTSSKTSEDPNPAECNLQVSTQQPDHIQNISQVTDSALFSESISISLQKCTDVRIGPLDNHLTAYPDKLSEDSHSIQCSSKNQDDALSDVTSQVPFDVGITLPVMLSCTQCMDEDQTEEENKELTSGGAQVQDQASDKTKISLPELQESIKPCRFNEFEIPNASKVEDFSNSTDHILVDDSCNHLVQPEMHTHHELKEQEHADLGVESLQVHQEDVPVNATICMWEPFEVTQNNPPRTSEMDVSKYYEQKLKSKLDLNELAEEDTTQVKSNKLYHASKEEEHLSYDTVQDSLSQMSVVEIPRMNSEEHEAAVRRDTDEQQQVSLRGEDNYKKCPEKLTDINICRQQPNVLTYFEQSCTLEERTPDPELSENPEQRRQSEPDLKGLADFKSEDTDNIGEKPILDSEEHKAAIKRDTDQEEQVGIIEDLTYINNCRQHPQVSTHIEQSCTFEESIPQHVSNSEGMPDPDSGYPEQRSESEPDLKGPSDFKSEDTDKEERVGITGDNYKHCPEELSEINMCWRQPHVLTHFEQSYTCEDSVPQTVSDSKITPDPDVVEYPQQREESESGPKEPADFTPGSKSLALVSVSELTCVSNKQYNNSTGHDICFEDFQNELVEKPEVQNEKHDTEVKVDTREETLADLQTESYQAEEDNPAEWQPLEVDNRQKVDDTSDQEVSFAIFNLSEGTSASNFKEDFFQSTGHNIMYTDVNNTLVKELEMQTPLVDDHLEQTKETKVFLSFSNLPTTSYPEVPKNHGQLQKSGSNLELDVFTMKDEIPSEEISLPTFVCEGTTTSHEFLTTVEAVSSEGEDGNSSSTQEELEDLSFNEEFELFYDEPAPCQKQEVLTSQLLLPSKTLQASSAQCSTILGQVLIPSLVAFSTIVCLVIGFNEPIVFLFVALLLVSVCF